MQYQNYDIYKEFLKKICDFKKEKGLSFVEINQMLEQAHMTFNEYVDSEAFEKKSYFTSHPDLKPETNVAFDKFWKETVQRTIDFINEHPDLKEVIEKERDNESYTLKSFTHRPDAHIGFSFDELMASAAEGEWVPVSDSYMAIKVGQKTIIMGF